MGTYNRSELLNEVSQLFRTEVDPGKEGGTLNTAVEYQQVLEMTSTAFLFNHESIFYLARLAANNLSATIQQEASILEDLLVLIDDLGEVGKPVRDTVSLSNARTATLSLDAAQSVTGRPETDRFVRQIDKFADQLKTNIASSSRTTELVRPREEARNLINTNLDRLAEVHEDLLVRTYALRDVLDEYLELDIPSRVSSTVLRSVDVRLQEAALKVQESSDAENLSLNRELFLQALANKVGVKLLDSFTDPTELKYRSPKRPIPPTLTHLGSVTGEGVPASVLTSAGPWSLPFSGPLELRDKSGVITSIDLSSVAGSAIGGTAPETFDILSDARNIHVSVDPTVWELSTVLASSTVVEHSATASLLFKHLGALVMFPEQSVAFISDSYPRYIAEQRHLLTAHSPSYSAPVLTAGSWTSVTGFSPGFSAHHVGGYYKDASGNVFEILEVLSLNQAVIDDRGAAVNVSSDGGVYGQDPGTTVFTVAPALSTPTSIGDRVVVGPSVKTAQLSVGAGVLVADVITDVESEAGVFDPGQAGATLNWHVKAERVPGSSPPQLALRIRSRHEPFVQVAASFPKPGDPTALLEYVGDSAHSTLGFLEGQSDDTGALSPVELVGILEDNGYPAELVEGGQVKISSPSAGPNSFLEVVSDYLDLGLSAQKVYSTLYEFQAKDKKGNTLSFDNAVAGDLLRVIGDPTEYPVTGVEGDTLEIGGGLPSTAVETGFEIRSLSAKLFSAMSESLQTFTTSRNLLRKNDFNEDVEAISVAVTAATLPGRNFIAARNQARRLVADLLSILTQERPREDEYTATIPPSSYVLADILSAYSPIGRVDAVDALVDMLLERKYDRAADLFRQGSMLDLYRTTDETGSYAGAVLAASRTVTRDLPTPSRDLEDVWEQNGGLSYARSETFDADEDFEDIEDQPEAPFE